MPGRADGREPAALGDGDRPAGREPRGLVGRGRADRVRVEHDRLPALRDLADPADVVRVVAERELRFRRAPRLLVLGEGLEEDADPLGPLDVVAGRMQACKVPVADEGAGQGASPRSRSRFERPPSPHFSVRPAARFQFGVTSGSLRMGASY